MFFFRKKFHLVVVCSANRTRSAYLEGYLKHYLSQYCPGALKRIHISSAGTKARSGGRANDVVALIARNNGFSLRAHSASPVTPKIMKKADLVLVMEQSHKDDLLKKYPFAKEKTFRLMEYGWQGDEKVELLNVPDPTGRNAEDFRVFIDTAHAEADRVIHELLHQGIL
jgi:protein-tyrosine-phosphatase